VVFDVRELREPEVRELGQDFSLVGHAGLENDVESGDPVACDEEEGVADVVEIADLAAAREARHGEVCLGHG
jgi:hypothetical protein